MAVKSIKRPSFDAKVLEVYLTMDVRTLSWTHVEGCCYGAALELQLSNENAPPATITDIDITLFIKNKKVAHGKARLEDSHLVPSGTTSRTFFARFDKYDDSLFLSSFDLDAKINRGPHLRIGRMAATISFEQDETLHAISLVKDDLDLALSHGR